MQTSLRPALPQCAYTRRDFLQSCTRAALAIPLLNSAIGFLSCGGGSAGSGPPPPPPLTDDQFLDQVQQAIFKFFWEQASASTGQIKDRAFAAGGNDNRPVSSIASTGFGLTALCIGHERGYGDRAQIRARVATTLDYLLNTLWNTHGFFYHFIDMNTGDRAFASEVSSIDTSILLGGVLTCRQYFSQDAQIPSLATQLYERVDWPWMLNGGNTFSMGWTPESGFLSSRWDTYCELMMIYLLAIGSPTFPVDPSSWDAFTRPTLTYQGLTYITATAPLFIHQYSHAWFDFRNKSDKYANYFDNSVMATQAHKLFCLSLQSQYNDYQSNLWGITASDYVGGYTAWGGPPALGPIDGSIVPCATGGSLAFASADSIAVLRHIYDTYPRAWQRYGFVDAFNPLTNWYDRDVIGINVGATMLMAENKRTQFVWNTFMANPEAQGAFQAVNLK